MSVLSTFQFPQTEQRVRTIFYQDQPWFVLADVCAVLGLSNPTKAAKALDLGEHFVLQPWQFAQVTTSPLNFREGWHRGCSMALVNEPQGLPLAVSRPRATCGEARPP